MTEVVVVTAEVLTTKLPVKPLSGAVVVAGTLATAGLLLDSEITAPPSGADVVRTTVPLDASPPTTVAGLRSSVDSCEAAERSAA